MKTQIRHVCNNVAVKGKYSYFPVFLFSIDVSARQSLDAWNDVLCFSTSLQNSNSNQFKAAYLYTNASLKPEFISRESELLIFTTKEEEFKLVFKKKMRKQLRHLYLILKIDFFLSGLSILKFGERAYIFVFQQLFGYMSLL